MISSNNVPRMRTIRQAIAEIRANDPQTAFSERALRQAIADGIIPVVYVGERKRLVNMAAVETYLRGIYSSQQPNYTGTIRRIGGITK